MFERAGVRIGNGWCDEIHKSDTSLAYLLAMCVNLEWDMKLWLPLYIPELLMSAGIEIVSRRELELVDGVVWKLVMMLIL